MTDNEIIKALECCSDIPEKSCKDNDCPFIAECGADLHILEKSALDLINRQKAEIESLKEALKDLKREMSYMSSPNTIGDRHEMGCW